MAGYAVRRVHEPRLCFVTRRVCCLVVFIVCFHLISPLLRAATSSHSLMQRAASLSSASSFSSISDQNADTDIDSQTTASSKSSEPKRTRKRFSQEQLIVLEQAYHKSTHPTREEREEIAKQADMFVFPNYLLCSVDAYNHQELQVSDHLVPEQTSS